MPKRSRSRRSCRGIVSNRGRHPFDAGFGANTVRRSRRRFCCAQSRRVYCPGIVHPRPSNWTVTGGSRVYIGRRIDTRSAPVALESDEIGRVELQPGADARVVESAPGRERFDLRQGRMHAFIWAPAGQFVVDTPGARAIDLGCQYDLTVDAFGNGLLSVQTGWVAFQVRHEESFIPAGAACRTTRAGGPGVPFLQDAPALVPGGAAPMGAGPRPKQSRHGAVHGSGGGCTHVVASPVPRPAERPRTVFDRFAQLVNLPATVERARVLAMDRAALDACWNALNLDNADWWREWKRDWRQ